MKTFNCESCGNRVYFENISCLKCAATLAFDPVALRIVALLPGADGMETYYHIGADMAKLAVTRCGNTVHGACNWLADPLTSSDLCVACDSNRTIPNLAEPGNIEAWQLLERAKKRLIYSLLRLGLPIDATVRGKGRLTFDFVRDATTGHLDGVITIDIMEADAVERERQRQVLGEPYRSLLGHLRHECGHFYWSVLIDAAGRHDAFRALFGDEREDYLQALSRHHATGAPASWSDAFVSSYARSHPWEDFAETFAHYLHMLAAVDTAMAQGMLPWRTVVPSLDEDVYQQTSFHELIGRWVPLAIALNSISRSMGHADFYPFVISDAVREKLQFVHDLIRQNRTAPAATDHNISGAVSDPAPTPTAQ